MAEPALLVGSVCEPWRPDPAEGTGPAAAGLRACSQGATALELRLDRVFAGPVDDQTLAEIVGDWPVPWMATCRDPSRAPAALAAAVDAGCAFVDTDVDDPVPVDLPRGVRRIVSHHDKSGALAADPGALAVMVERLLEEAGQNGLAKLVVAVDRAPRIAALLEAMATANADRPCLAAFPLAGLWSLSGRLLAPSFGAPLVYGAADPLWPAVTNQPSLGRLAALLPEGGASATTTPFAVLGGPQVARSWSPACHARVFGALGRDAVFTALGDDDWDALWGAFGHPPFGGFAVTAPHKAAARAIADGVLDDFDPGVTNTLLREGEHWACANTDGPAVRELVAAVVGQLNGVPAAVFGRGGAGRAVAAAFDQAGCGTALLGRGETALEGTRILVNATSADPDEPPREILRSLTPGALVVDMAVDPPVTPLLRDAMAVGGHVVTGDEMFRGQGRRQAGLLNDPQSAEMAAEAFDEAVDVSAAAAAARRGHIWLVGPRGAGKTTIGALLAEALERPFVDTDRLVEEDAGQDVAGVLTAEGKEGFRAREAAAVDRAGAGDTAVIATGGGAVTDDMSRARIGHQGRVIHLSAPDAVLLERTVGTSRPSLLPDLSPEAEVRALLNTRGPLYALVADVLLDTSHAPPAALAARLLAWLSAGA